MIERYFLIFWAAWLLLILIAAFRVLGFGAAKRWQERKWRDRTRNQQSTALIISVKGFDLQGTPRFFDAMFSQDYRDYRVIVTFESWNDPVATWLTEQLELSETESTWESPDFESRLQSVTLVCAGTSQTEGQKVHNQIAAFRELKPSDAVIAFADADIVCGSDWLARLLAPINLGTHPLSSTYRWLVPKRPTLPNQFASVINGSITTQGGSELTNVLWGGSMAMTRKAFEDIEVPSLLSGSVNDDLRISKAARKSRNRIAFVRSLILPTVIDFSWASFFEFAKRQYTQVKFFSPILYLGTNFFIGFYALGAISLIGALFYGYFYAWVPIAAAYVIDQFRGLARQQVYLSLFPENEIRRRLFATCWLEHMLTPVWMLMHWFILVSTWTQNRISWSGVQYRILSKSKTRVLSRQKTTDTLPASTPGLALIAALHDKKRGTYTQPIEPAETAAAETIGESEPQQTAVVPFKAPLPSSVGPYAHPGLSSYVTKLSSAPRFGDYRPEPGLPRSALATRLNAIEALRQIPRWEQATSSRYQPNIEEEISTDIAVIGKSVTFTQPLAEALVHPKIPTPRADVFPQLGKSERDSDQPHPRNRAARPRVQTRLAKTRVQTSQRYATNPALAHSAPPTGKASPSPQPTSGNAPSPPNHALASAKSPQLRSVASRPAASTRKDLRMGIVTRKTSRSSRANHVGTANRGTGRNRPGCHKASGRCC